MSAPEVDPAFAAEYVAAEDAVRAAGEAARAAQDELEQAIVAFRRVGASMAAVGAAAGYSAPGILGILRRHGVR